MTKPPSPQPALGAETAWFVQTAGQVWGPYNRVRVERFAIEGRVTPHSLLATQVEGPFQPAGRWRSLSALFEAPLFQASKPYRHQPAPSNPAPRPASGSPAGPQAESVAATEPPSSPKPAPAPRSSLAQNASTNAPLRPLLVWADLASLGAPQFEALVARYGALAVIRPTVWLLQSRLDAAALRNALSRRLTGADALMIVHAPLDQAAWFNLDSAAERGLRQLWGEILG